MNDTAVLVHIRTEWVLLTDQDIEQGLKHRPTFLERLCRRHSIGLDEAEDQLRKFEARNPELAFERY